MILIYNKKYNYNYVRFDDKYNLGLFMLMKIYEIWKKI
jgi:hypothetical protein